MKIFDDYKFSLEVYSLMEKYYKGMKEIQDKYKKNKPMNDEEEKYLSILFCGMEFCIHTLRDFLMDENLSNDLGDKNCAQINIQQ
jgi:hypothetical protein